MRLAILNWLRRNSILDQRTAETLKIQARSYVEDVTDEFDSSFLILPHAIELLTDLLQCTISSSQPLEFRDLVDRHTLSTTFPAQSRDLGQPLENVDITSILMIYTSYLLDCACPFLRGHGSHCSGVAEVEAAVVVGRRREEKRKGR